MKKTISALLCAFLIISAFCLPAAAESKEAIKSATISFAEASGNPGGEVFVNLYMADNSKITDYVFSLNFKESTLKYDGYYKGALSDYTFYDHTDEGRLTFVSLNGESEAKNGVLITFKFAIDKNAKPGDYKLSLTKTYFADKDGNSQKAVTESGKVTVAKPCSDNHTFSKWKSLISADCTNAGIDTRVCENCGCTESKPVEAKGHKLEKMFTLDVEAKGSKPGMLSRHCTECGAKTNIVIYTADNTAGLSINDMVGKISDTSIENLIYFINGNVTYPDITDEDFDVSSLISNIQSPINEDGSINAASAIDGILRKLFGSDKKSGIVGAIKRAVLADEIPVKFIGKLVKFIFGW